MPIYRCIGTQRAVGNGSCKFLQHRASLAACRMGSACRYPLRKEQPVSLNYEPLPLVGHRNGYLTYAAVNRERQLSWPKVLKMLLRPALGECLDSTVEESRSQTFCMLIALRVPLFAGGHQLFDSLIRSVTPRRPQMSGTFGVQQPVNDM